MPKRLKIKNKNLSEIKCFKKKQKINSKMNKNQKIRELQIPRRKKTLENKI